MSTEKLGEEEKHLAAMTYGEASWKDVPEEMKAIASVLVRQRDARGYTDMTVFVTKDKTFSFVVKDGNKRYAKFMKATEAQIEKDPGMSAAVAAAKNALAGGEDLSNGAYFWDGADIKSNYAKHFKVKHGVRFTNPAHNIYGIEESSKLVIKNRTDVTKKKGKIVKIETIELYRYDHVYRSTAAYGGTIFWNHNAEYMKHTGAKAHK